MTDFKVGDIIVRSEYGTEAVILKFKTPNMALVKILKQGLRGYLSPNPGTTNLYSAVLDLWYHKETESKPEEPKMSKNWSCRISHPEAVDWNILSAECTRENPLVFVVVDKRHSVIIHSWIVNKAGLCGITAPTVLLLNSRTTYRANLGTIKDREKWLAWTREVIQAPWPGNEKNITLEVIIPEL